MKRLIQIAAIAAAALIVVVAAALYPKFSNMKSEYGTAEAIRDIEAYVREIDGEWPSSPEQSQHKYYADGDVVIDYSITSVELIANPEKLKSKLGDEIIASLAHFATISS